MKLIKSVCVFCGSQVGRNPGYAFMARALGKSLANDGIRLVFGGGGIGLMNEVATAAMSAGGEVVGIIPDYLAEAELAIAGLTEQVIVSSLDDRKKQMFTRADSFVALPGGIGTLDEVLDLFLWRQVGLHDKPLVLLNHEHFWDPLITLLNHHQREGFIPNMDDDYYTIVDSADKVIPALKRAREPKVKSRPDLF
jgi:uncharacterized protein (TIGR00730 family)